MLVVGALPVARTLRMARSLLGETTLGFGVEALLAPAIQIPYI
jgi:hypothetical protein